MKIGVLGSGTVAQTLAAGFLKHGHAVTIGTRDPSKLADWGSSHPGIAISSFANTAESAELIVLAVKGSIADKVLQLAGSANLKGKTVIDACNPISDTAPVNGVLGFFTGIDDSLMEQLQRELADVHFVKAFNSVGSARMVNPVFAGGKPSMFICGNDAQAKATVTTLLDQFGWDVEDMGAVEAARAIEPLSMLWCIPGFSRNEWTHAFKVLH